jgi:hypothetical protein
MERKDGQTPHSFAGGYAPEFILFAHHDHLPVSLLPLLYPTYPGFLKNILCVAYQNVVFRTYDA